MNKLQCKFKMSTCNHRIRKLKNYDHEKKYILEK